MCRAYHTKWNEKEIIVEDNLMKRKIDKRENNINHNQNLKKKKNEWNILYKLDKPYKYINIFKMKDKDQWLLAIKEEFNTMKKRGVFERVEKCSWNC